MFKHSLESCYICQSIYFWILVVNILIAQEYIHTKIHMRMHNSPNFLVKDEEKLLAETESENL